MYNRRASWTHCDTELFVCYALERMSPQRKHHGPSRHRAALLLDRLQPRLHVCQIGVGLDFLVGVAELRLELGLVLVDLLPQRVRRLLHVGAQGLLLLLLLLFLLIDLLDLRLVAFFLLVLLLLLLVLGVRHLLLLGLLHVQLNGETDELRVLLDQILQAALLQELRLVLLQVTDDLGAALNLPVHHFRVLLHREGAASPRLPDVLLVVVVLADHAHLVRDEVRGVETDSELPDHGDVAAGCHCLHEGLGARLGDGAEVVDQLVLGHADARVLDRDGGVGLVGDDLDIKIRLGLDLVRIRDGLVPDLVQGI
mmetsp:Transcript_53431/g.149254  ORF Transcript_53431/g.149254 Transcript_53431/m.149254 type:complete len:311 (-) Transcript_53431:192-1124(-)